MRISVFLAISLLAAAVPAHSQEAEGGFSIPKVTYPKLVASAQSVQGFIPPGWKLESQVIGDLNNDKRADILFVLRMTDPGNIIDNQGGLGEPAFDSNPRMLTAIFKRDNDFILALANHTLIPRRTDPVLDDVLGQTGGVELKGRTIAVRLHSFSSAGGWDAGNRTLRFRWQKDAFRLIGWDNWSMHRGSGEITETSVNFLTGVVVEGKGTMEDDELTATKRKVPKAQLLTIDEVGDGMMFEPKL